MTQLPSSGVLKTANSWNLMEDGNTVFLFDHATRQIIQHKLDSDTKTTLTVKSSKYAMPNWLCYCLFAWIETTESQSSHRIALLMFDQITWKFKLVVFEARRNVLKLLAAFPIGFTPVNPERLGYSAHTHQGKIEIIFYDRYLTRSVANDGSFCYIAIDRASLRFLRRTSGKLPKDGFWEVPFISNMYLHFVSLKRREQKIACILLEQDNVIPSHWTVTPLNADITTNQFPSQRATWCHSWELRVPFFAVAKPMSDGILQTVSLWSIDVASKQWQRHADTISVPTEATNFGIRAAQQKVVLHCDMNPASAVYFAFDVTLILTSPLRRSSPLTPIMELDQPETSKTYADITCPICLETYTDPRTLFCGHSLCFACLIRLRETSPKDEENSVKCPNCRKVTKVPDSGLPTNYSLQEALQLMLKEQMIRDSPFKCGSCRDLGLCESFWVCIQCQPTMPPKKISETVLTCPGCILKEHSGHITKDFNEFKEYFDALKTFKADCDAKINVAATKIKATLEEKLNIFVTDRLKASADQIVDAFCAEKVAHSCEIIDAQGHDVDETLDGIIDRIVEAADESFSALLENAILDGNQGISNDSDKQTTSVYSSMTEDELAQALLKLPI